MGTGWAQAARMIARIVAKEANVHNRFRIISSFRLERNGNDIIRFLHPLAKK
jgi:hypothetical protein